MTSIGARANGGDETDRRAARWVDPGPIRRRAASCEEEFEGRLGPASKRDDSLVIDVALRHLTRELIAESEDGAGVHRAGPHSAATA
jgi:hypothetical protein